MQSLGTTVEATDDLENLSLNTDAMAQDGDEWSTVGLGAETEDGLENLSTDVGAETHDGEESTRFGISFSFDE